MTVRISSFVEISTNGKYTPYADKMQEKFASLAKFVSPNWDLSYCHHLLCHSERSRTLCGEVEESVLFTLF